VKAELEVLKKEKKDRAAKAKEKRSRWLARKKETSSDNTTSTSDSTDPEPVTPNIPKKPADKSPYKSALGTICLPDADVLAAVRSSSDKLSTLKKALREARPGPVEHIRDVWLACFGRASDLPKDKEKALADLSEFLQKNVTRLMSK
jgi:hypothetical protein